MMSRKPASARQWITIDRRAATSVDANKQFHCSNEQKISASRGSLDTLAFYAGRGKASSFQSARSKDCVLRISSRQRRSAVFNCKAAESFSARADLESMGGLNLLL